MDFRTVIRLRATPAILAALAVAVTCGLLLEPLVRLDGVEGLIGILFGSDTEYADGYSHRRFLRVTTGMTEAQVVSLLGSPLRLSRDSEPRRERWFFSRSPGSKNYRCRVLEFRDGRVAEIHSEFFFD